MLLPFETCGRADELSMRRSLGQLFASTDILSGEEGETLRQYCNSVQKEFRNYLKDPYGRLIEDGSLTAFQEHFQGRVQHFEGRQHEAAQELFKLKWGPTRLPVYVLLLAFADIKSDERYNYIAIAEWLVDTAKVPVDGMCYDEGFFFIFRSRWGPQNCCVGCYPTPKRCLQRVKILVKIRLLTFE